MIEATLNLPQSEIEKIQQLYTLQDIEPVEVLQFIEKYPFLIPLLLEAPEKIREFFPDASLKLKVDIDPESYSDESNELVLLIKSDIDPEESVDRLEQLDDAWWAEVEYLSQHKMFTTLG